MDQYMSSLAKACLTWGGVTKFYSENVPLNFAVPSLYFPPYEVDALNDTLNSYQTTYTIYANVFAATRQDAMEIAEKIVRGVMEAKCLIPVLNADGTKSGSVIRLDPPEARVVDEGVAQLTLAYRIVRKPKGSVLPKAKGVEINKYYD